MKHGKWIGSVLTAVFFMIGSTSIAVAEEIPTPDYPSFEEEVTITWWTWTANTDKVIKEFNNVYPNIEVKPFLIGAGKPQYNKLTTAIMAGTGAPDVVQIEYQYLPKFIDSGGLLDISEYVDRYEPFFQPWTWEQTRRGEHVYAIPEDIGPLVLLFRPDVFEKYGLSQPETWDEFAENAKELHQKNPDQSMAYFPVNNGGWITGMLWQAGVQPFQRTSDGWKINLNSPEAKKVINFWGDLIDKGYVDATNDYTPSWESNIGKGKYASAIGAAWSPTYMIEPYVKPETKNWKAVDIPQWEKDGSFQTGNWGGSSNAVTKQSAHPEAAALFAAWINSSRKGLEMDIKGIKEGGRGQVPANKYGVQLPEFSEPNPALSNQVSGPVFEKAANSVNTSFQWSPWTDFVYNQMTIEFTKAATGEQSWDEALDNLQRSVTVFAKSMGYKVVEDEEAGTSGESVGGAINSPAIPVLLVLAGLGVLTWRVRRSSV
ncbi:ABC transporter substrate-binding protein [Desmospora activa]|uniref:Multiple sugar transport system substrate-binding protein n=1 Tax=Desmospora activa DSM 45169 TaxID=1121389 RepID=A0A2T4ZB29_9BACL|nr:sugar ABC transporter substrate-binding protein [Desmospora activa]PTM59067.1 multiple sugar transport system substrate-binding protein [Desmospora activa DSM 45169]